MASIIGRTDLIRHFRDKSTPSKARGGYKKRNELLPEIGYASYKEYLDSNEWKTIRKNVLERHPNCCVCNAIASQVHHWSYSTPVILGICKELLFPICDRCHEEVEFDGDRKRTIPQARKVLAGRLLPPFHTRLKTGQTREKRLLKESRQNEHDSKKQAKKQKKENPGHRYRLGIGLKCEILTPGSTEWRAYTLSEPVECDQRSSCDNGRCWLVLTPNGSTLKVDVESAKKSGCFRKY